MMMFQALGLGDDEQRVYLALLEQRDASPALLARVTGLPSSRVRAALLELEATGFVSRAPGKRPAYSPARPDLAVEAMVLRRTEELRQARRDAEALLERFSLGSEPRPDDVPIEFIVGREAVAQRWVQIQRSARREVKIFDRPPYVISPSGPNPIELDLLRSGVAYRVLYAGSAFELPTKREAAQACIAAGEQARLTSELPMKLLIADESIALTHDGADVRERALIIHPSSILSALLALFEYSWRDAALVPALSGDSAGGLDPLDASILHLMSAGFKDETIARQLRLGVRTARRHIADLMHELGADTRFQAAILAKSRGWL